MKDLEIDKYINISMVYTDNLKLIVISQDIDGKYI